MAYYDTIRNRSTFRQKAVSEQAQSFILLSIANDAPKTISLWDRRHLFALRVLCRKPTKTLTVLDPHFASDGTFNAYIQALVSGPDQDLQTLAKMSEPEIVRFYNPDSLGAVWAALGALLRPHESQDPTQQDAESRLPRNRQPPQRFGNPVPTESVQFGSSPPDQRPPTSSSSGTGSIASVGYTENPQAAAIEDLTVHLASCFVRYVLNYGQELSRPIVEFRNEKVSYSSQLLSQSERATQAIDDGGIRMLQTDGKAMGVALLEAKRRLLAIQDGKPTVSDGSLAQMVGQALLSHRYHTISASRQVIIAFPSFASPLIYDLSLIKRPSVITIHAARHYVKFFHFEVSPFYLESFEELSPVAPGDTESYLLVNTSEWFDIATKRGREMTVRHLLALVKWAQAAEADRDPEDAVMEEGDF